jgi:hypothetical protein
LDLRAAEGLAGIEVLLAVGAFEFHGDSPDITTTKVQRFNGSEFNGCRLSTVNAITVNGEPYPISP